MLRYLNPWGQPAPLTAEQHIEELKKLIPPLLKVKGIGLLPAPLFIKIHEHLAALKSPAYQEKLDALKKALCVSDKPVQDAEGLGFVDMGALDEQLEAQFNAICARANEEARIEEEKAKKIQAEQHTQEMRVQAQQRFTDKHFEQELDVARRREAILAARSENLRIDSEQAVFYRELLDKELEKVTAVQVSAQQHFDANDFGAIADVQARRQAVLHVQTAVAGLHLSVDVAQVYNVLLAGALTAINATLAAAQQRFNHHNFAAELNVQARRDAMANAQAAVAGLNLGADEAQAYNALLTQALAAANATLTAAQQRFNQQHFDAEFNVQVRRQAIVNAQAAIAGLQLNADEAQAYGALLIEALMTIDATLDTARQRFADQHFEAQLDIHARRDMVANTQEELAELHLSADETQAYGALLTQALTAIDAILAAAQQRFDDHHFDAELNVQLRRQAIVNAQAAIAGLHLSADESQAYDALLTEALNEIDECLTAAQQRFNDHYFDAELNVQARRQAVVNAQGAVAGLHLSADETQAYEALLTQALTAIDAILAAAQQRFNDQHFEAELNVQARRQAVVNAQGAVAGLHLSADETQAYGALLTQALTAIDAILAAAQQRFNDHHFEAELNVQGRRQAVVNAQGAVAGLHLSPDETQVYGNLLAQRLAAIDLGIASAQQRFVDQHFEAELNVQARRAAVANAQTGIAGLGLGADEAQAYSTLLVQTLTAIDATLAAAQQRFNDHHFEAYADLTVRRQRVADAQAGIAGLGLGADEAQAYGNLLTLALNNIDAGIAAERLAQQQQAERLRQAQEALTQQLPSVATLIATHGSEVAASQAILSAFNANPHQVRAQYTAEHVQLVGRVECGF